MNLSLTALFHASDCTECRNMSLMGALTALYASSHDPPSATFPSMTFSYCIPLASPCSLMVLSAVLATALP